MRISHQSCEQRNASVTFNWFCTKRACEMHTLHVSFSFVLNLALYLGVKGSMHWAVTENGRIEAQVDSVFHLRRPFDLIAFMEQEARLQSLDEIYNELLARKSAIDRKWVGMDNTGGEVGIGKGRGLRGVKAGDLEARLYAEDPDCVGAGGKPLSLAQLFPGSAAIASLMREEMRLENNLKSILIEEGSMNIEPDCESSYPLELSMQAFEHLLGLKERRNLSMEPEPSLESAFLFHLHNSQIHTKENPDMGENVLNVEEEEIIMLEDKRRVRKEVDQFGMKVGRALSLNGTSWPLHNLASLYWRIIGNAPRAIECARRAVHLSPSDHRDVGLAQMGWVLLASGRPAEAAIVLHAALDHSAFSHHFSDSVDKFPLHTSPPATHLALANAYALLSDYNRSLACYENALKLQPGLKVAQLGRHSILCQQKLEKALLNMVDSLHDILTELQEYHKKQEEWLKLQERLLWEQAPLEIRLLNYGHDKLLSSGAGHHKNCIHHQREGHMILSCDLEASHSLEIDITLSLQMLMKNVETQAKKISKAMSQRIDKGREMMSAQLDEDVASEDSGGVNLASVSTQTMKDSKDEISRSDLFEISDKSDAEKSVVADHMSWKGDGEVVGSYESEVDGSSSTETSLPSCPSPKQQTVDYHQYACRSSNIKSTGVQSLMWQENANNKA